MRLINDAGRAATAIHWHGVRVAERHGRRAGADPGSRSRPAQSFDYRFTPPDAGTFWYHPPLTATAGGRAAPRRR